MHFHRPHKKEIPLVVAALLVGLAISFLPLLPNVKAEVINSSNTNTGSGATLTCTLFGVIKFDVLYVAISGTQTVTSIADTSGEAFTSQTSTLVASATVHANTYIYSSTAALSEGTEVITITWSSAAQGVATCYDTAGWGATASAAATPGTGTISKAGANLTIVATVSSYVPTVGTLEISSFGGSVCEAPGTFTVTPPLEKTVQKTLPAGVATATSCRTSAPSGNYVYVGASAANSTVKGTTAFTDAWTVNGAQAAGSPGTNSANWGEVAAYFPANTVVAKSLTETVALTAHNALQNPAVTETASLTQHLALENPLLTEPMALFTKFALPQPFNTEQFCLGVAIKVNNVTTLTNPANCVAQVITGQTLVLACNWFQLQCWLYSMMFIGLYEGLFIGIAIGFRFSEKGFVYWAICGATIASLAAIQLGIMTPMVPIMLIVVNVAYSFRLDRLITSRGGGTAE